MIAFLLAALAGVLTVRAHRNAARLDEAALERARRAFAVALVVQSALVAEVRTFEGETGPADDITVLIARRTR